MVDTLMKQKDNLKKPEIWDEVGLKDKNYMVLTLHRPANVDRPELLENILKEILANSKDKIIVFRYTRTFKVFKKTVLGQKNENINTFRLFRI